MLWWLGGLAVLSFLGGWVLSSSVVFRCVLLSWMLGGPCSPSVFGSLGALPFLLGRLVGLALLLCLVLLVTLVSSFVFGLVGCSFRLGWLVGRALLPGLGWLFALLPSSFLGGVWALSSFSFLDGLGSNALLSLFRSGLGHCPPFLSGVSVLLAFVVVVGPCSPSVFGVIGSLAVLVLVGVLLLFVVWFGALLSFSVWVVCGRLGLLFFLGWLVATALLPLFLVGCWALLCVCVWGGWVPCCPCVRGCPALCLCLVWFGALLSYSAWGG